MSNGRAFRRHLVNLLGPLDGARVPGGCATCDAYQTTAPVADGVWQVTVHHDADCTTFSTIEANR